MMDWQLHIGHQPPWPLVLALGLAFALAIREFVLARRRRKHHPKQAARELRFAALRMAALIVVASLAFELGVQVRDEMALRSRVAVLFDASASMSIRENEGQPSTRWQRALAHWKGSQSLLPHWREEGLAPELYSFGSSLDPLGDELGGGPPRQSASRLGSAFVRLNDLGRKRSTPLASILLYSDGLVALDDAGREALLEDAASLNLPINAVFCAEEGLRDLAIGQLAVGEFAFVENLATIEATLHAHGLAGERVEVQLRREGEFVAKREVLLDDRVKRSLSFEFAPEATGQFAYEVFVLPVDGEASVANNQRSFVLKVLRDKIRVLHVAGRPDWDVRSLRTLMRRDPNVELLSYYILRDEDDTLRGDADAPMSLIAFPTQELFHEQLGSFDLIILHNFDALTHGNYLNNLARYVEDGGSLVLIGGDLGLATGDYADSPVAPYLPVRTQRGPSLSRDPYTPTLSPDGRRHPITSWLSANAANPAGRQGLVELDSFNPAQLRTRGEFPGRALLYGPNDAPLLSVAEPGRGRTLVLATGASWRLGFAADLELIDGSRPYDLLWLGIIRWALRDVSADRLSVQTDKLNYVPGEQIAISARTSSPSYQPEPAVELRWQLVRLSGALDTPDDANKGQPLRQGHWTTDPLGRAQDILNDLPQGAYAIQVEREEATLSDQDAARRVFVVSSSGVELAALDARPGAQILRDLAEQSGGVFLEGPNASLPASLPQREGSEAANSRLRERPLWSTWPALLALLALLGAEWYLRRRAGLR